MNTAPAPRKADFTQELAAYEGQIAAALPSHIPLERFKRVIITAVNQNPELVGADRRSLFISCVRAAQDGLLPDSREAALVIFRDKKRGLETVQYMPMVQGILKKVRNTGDLATISAHVVYRNDVFSYALGDDEHITHRPALQDRGVPIGAYAIARLKDGSVQREFMTIEEIEKARAVSRAGKSEYGPWTQWWSEMARKTVVRRLAKYLPSSSDLDRILANDETMELDSADAQPRDVTPRPTRAEFSPAPQPQAIPEEHRMPPLLLTDFDGEVTEFAVPAEYAQALAATFAAAPDAFTVSALWDENSEQVNRLLDDFDRQDLADIAREAYQQASAARRENGARQ